MERAELKRVLHATGCAEEHGDFVFLCDPNWTTAERHEASVWTSGIIPKPDPKTGWLCVRTGGSGGGIKFARHDERSLSAAARGFCEHFKMSCFNAVDVLPAHHVSGLMARVRCATTGGQHVAWDWKRLERGECPEAVRAGGDWVISLVPTQLQRLLTVSGAVEWLRRFKIIFVGGGPVWPDLATTAARNTLPVSLTYGMTETAAMVTALRPEEFLAGERTCGAALPHAQISLDAEGIVTVAGESLFRGYFPALRDARPFQTEDLGGIDARGHLQIFGRRDSTIITGGKKVYPAEVEAVLRGSGEFADVAVIGVPDAEWGQAVVAGFPASGPQPNFARATAALASHQRPKRFVPLANWPRNAQGKVDRAAVLAAILRE